MLMQSPSKQNLIHRFASLLLCFENNIQMETEAAPMTSMEGKKVKFNLPKEVIIASYPVLHSITRHAPLDGEARNWHITTPVLTPPWKNV